MNHQTLFLPDTDILLQPKVSNRDHAGYKEGDHVDLYIHRRPAIGGDRVSSVLSREWDLFHIPPHYSFSVRAIVSVLVALLNNLWNVLLSLFVAVVHCDAFSCTWLFFSQFRHGTCRTGIDLEEIVFILYGFLSIACKVHHNVSLMEWCIL